MRDSHRAKEEVWSAHEDFHVSLYRAGASRWLMRLIMPLWQASNRYRHATGLEDWHMADRETEHVLILRACERHDPGLAASLLYDHLVATTNLISGKMGGTDLFERKRPAPPKAKAREKPGRTEANA